MKFRVREAELPSESLLHRRAGPTDFLDCYTVRASMPARSAANIIVDFPGWARLLLLLRRVLTAPFGLSNDGPSSADKIGPFPIELETDDELVAGFDDKHLNFRVSILSREGRVFLATWVHPHNLGGRLYLRGILPFHILIARDALRRVALRGAAWAKQSSCGDRRR
ncbi:MAG: DUF2867 domain-containing protein [Gammaproteobacteria bacterium]|nr:DUF2867 domain-containing protein [Gammaproteobacteria bacterium]